MTTGKITARYALILGIVALLCTAISIGVYILTKGRIDAVSQQQQRQLLLEVLPQAHFDNDLLATCMQVSLPQAPFVKKLYLAKKGEKTTAYALQSTAPDGYSGNIELLIGVQPDGTILGVRTLSHKETPGLGDKIDTRISDWIFRFTGKKWTAESDRQWAVKKDGGQFDQFTGATITPRAVVNNVRQSASWVVRHLNPTILSGLTPCEQ
ncbi:electron transport complex subunit RsxG [Pasteurellaceae bacterium Macca]|nr:electron transport complex subunit RsxG [Pasteurellaceae bacterium Macca]